MPEMDGVETTRHIRSIVGSDTPIIILTSYIRYTEGDHIPQNDGG